MTKRTICDDDLRNDVKLTAEFETGRYSIDFSKVDRDNRNGNCCVTVVVV